MKRNEQYALLPIWSWKPHGDDTWRHFSCSCNGAISTVHRHTGDIAIHIKFSEYRIITRAKIRKWFLILQGHLDFWRSYGPFYNFSVCSLCFYYSPEIQCTPQSYRTRFMFAGCYLNLLTELRPFLHSNSSQTVFRRVFLRAMLHDDHLNTV